MAMHGFDQEDFSAPLAEINTTPLVDVMLVLLVIFLVTAPMLTQAIKLQLPNEVATQITDENLIHLSITHDGVYYWGEEAVSEPELEQRLKMIALKDKSQFIQLRADTRVAYGKVSKLLALIHQYELTHIGFVTEQKL